MECYYCNSACKKDGKHNNGTQKYRYKTCKKYQQKNYNYQACLPAIKQLIPKLMIEGNSFSGLARGLNINRKTILKTVLKESGRLLPPLIKEEQQCYEIDEALTFINKKIPANYIYVTYAINRETKQVIELTIGKRTSANLKKVTDAVLKLNSKRIYTDGLNIYTSLLKKPIHKVSRHMTVNIEIVMHRFEE